MGPVVGGRVLLAHFLKAATVRRESVINRRIAWHCASNASNGSASDDYARMVEDGLLLNERRNRASGVDAKLRPRRRPRKLNELNPTGKPVRSKKIRPPTAA
jgi:hypothetical protein